VKNILYIVSWYNPKSLVGGFFMEQAECLLERNVRIYFLFETKDKDYLNKITQLNEKLFLIGIKPLTDSKKNQIFQKVIAILDRYFFVKNFNRILGSVHFTGIIAQNLYKAGYFAFWLKRKFKIPYVIIQHNPLSLKGEDYYRNSHNVKHILCGSDRNYCVSHDLIRQFRGQRIFNAMDKLINPIGLKKYATNVKKCDSLNIFQGLKIGLSGQYGNIKNQKLFFDALALLNNELTMPIKVIWLGYSSWGSFVDRGIMDSELGLNRFNPNVVFDFFDIVERNEMAEKLSCCDIFVSTSYNETFGIAQIEALSLGIPVCTTQNGGCNEFMEDDYGVIVNSFNPTDFADALLGMIKRLNCFEREKISEKVVRDFSNDVYMNKLQEISFLN
jgi:glycosyltransferase involved in cell wall biosynthesis